MRQESWLAPLAILVTAMPGVAAPGPATPPAARVSKDFRVEARRFAQQLGHLVEQVANQYVRPVNREDLLEAALVALYQAARKPVPRDLRQQIRQALALSGMLRAKTSGNNLQAVSASRPVVDPVEKMLARVREDVGEAEALAGQNPVLICCKALPKLLDSYSGLITAEEQRRAIGTDQESIGVGLEFKPTITPGSMEVEVVHPGSPAQRAGLRPGDVITHLDGKPVNRAAPVKLLALRNSRVQDDVPALAVPNPAPATALELPRQIKATYRRPDEKEDRTVVLPRERYRTETVLGVRRRDDNTWDWFADEKAGLAHLRIATLARGTSEELREVLATLRERKVKGLLLDLRWCPGGFLNEAVETADLFLGAGTVATVKNRGREDTVYRSTDEAKFRDFAVVVLVNSKTSGGAELIAAALQDHKRALVVGQRTLGKGSVQTPLPVGLEGVGFKLTSGTFVRPSGKNLHRFPDSRSDDVWGVIPDEDARLSVDLGKRLEQWWLWQSLRPVRSIERLPLDDPRADPQQQMALGVLRKRVK